MATYRVKLFSKKKDNKKYTPNDVPFIDRLKIKAGRIGDKITFKPENYREDYASALKNGDMSDFVEKYKGYHAKKDLAIGSGLVATTGGLSYHLVKKHPKFFDGFSPKKMALLTTVPTATGLGLAVALQHGNKAAREALAAQMEFREEDRGRKHIEKSIALNKAIGSKKSKREYMSEFAKTTRKNK